MCARSVVGVTGWIICHIFLPAKFGGAKKQKKKKKKKKKEGRRRREAKLTSQSFCFLLRRGRKKKEKKVGKRATHTQQQTSSASNAASRRGWNGEKKDEPAKLDYCCWLALFLCLRLFLFLPWGACVFGLVVRRSSSPLCTARFGFG